MEEEHRLLEYALERIENTKEKLNSPVEKMRVSKDKSLLVYNSVLTLKGIPPETTSTNWGIARRCSRSSINTRSQPTNAAASPTTPTAKTTPNTSSASSARWCM